MTLTNPKGAGWGSGEVLTSTQMNSFGTQLPYAIDGNAGGTYAPSDPIIIGGDGLSVTGTLAISGTCTRVDALYGKRYFADVILGSASWSRTPAGLISGQYIFAQTTANAAIETCLLPAQLPIGATITSYGMRILPTGGHGALPAGMPSVGMYQLDQDLGSTVTVGTTFAVDSSANVGAYQVAHTVSKTGLTHTILADRQYYIACTGEYSTNRVNDMYVTAVWVVVAAP